MLVSPSFVMGSSAQVFAKPPEATWTAQPRKPARRAPASLLVVALLADNYMVAHRVPDRVADRQLQAQSGYLR